MADNDQIKILKKGVVAWNEWRKENPEVRPDLRGADLHGAKLKLAHLGEADLSRADLSEAVLSLATLTGADLCQAKLFRANLVGADIRWADVSGACIAEANLSWANLIGASLTGADLHKANFSRANLIKVDLTGAQLGEANFTNLFMASTQLGNVDLSRIKGLAKVKHRGPSTIGIDTIYRSSGNIPEIFLRGAGVPEPFIVQMKSLVAAMSPIEFYSCFISYSSKNQEFAERLHTDLRGKGVHCWFAPKDLKIGDKMRPVFDKAIQVHDKLMVLLSQHSVKSPWVEKEVETAFEKERQQNRTVLFPIRLDDAVMKTDKAWAADIRRTRHIGDFCKWKDHDLYKKAFDRLLRDLKAEDKAAHA